MAEDIESALRDFVAAMADFTVVCPLPLELPRQPSFVLVFGNADSSKGTRAQDLDSKITDCLWQCDRFCSQNAAIPGHGKIINLLSTL